MMKQYFKLVIEYDGTLFSGWQRQKNRTTVQGELEKVIGIILNQEIHIAGSGRTDAGVHATGQTASFEAITSIPPDRLKKGINSLIKQPLVIRECLLVDEDFHARFSALSKEYRYHILNRQEPCAIGAAFSWHVPRPLDIASMEACCRVLTGTHDFKSFENAGSPRVSTVRTMYKAEIFKENDMVRVDLQANGFLKNMVRNIVGTLVDAGHGKISRQAFTEILKGRDRTLAGATAPARGLILHRVYYPQSDQVRRSAR